MNDRHSPEYIAYLRSPEWAARRAEALDAADHQCEGFRDWGDDERAFWDPEYDFRFECGRTDRLSVHHVTYERLGHEEPSDLMVLCPNCHTEADEHRRLRAADERWWRTEGLASLD